MVDCHSFDVWADDYDEDVRLADEKNVYPFAGYKKIMNSIYTTVTKTNSTNVLDIGVGTGTLAAALYARGHIITGIDFSREMLAIAKPKMPNATFFQCDFTNDLPPEMNANNFDFIISTYALHHLPDVLKATFIKSLLPYLSNNGTILIGDIGFATRVEYTECQKRNSDVWDNNEYYFVFTELTETLKNDCSITYKQMSHCGGLLEIKAL